MAVSIYRDSNKLESLLLYLQKVSKESFELNNSPKLFRANVYPIKYIFLGENLKWNVQKMQGSHTPTIRIRFHIFSS